MPALHGSGDLPRDPPTPQAAEASPRSRDDALSSARKVLREKNLSQALQTICEMACHVLAAERALVEQVVPEEPPVHTLVHACNQPTDFLEAFQEHPHSGSFLSDAFRRGELRIVHNPHRDPRSSDPDTLRAAGVRTLCVIPLTVRGRPFGGLLLHHLTHRDYGPHERALATAFGELASLALEKARLLGEVEEGASRLALAREIARTIGSTLEPKELFRAIVQEIRRLVPCERCAILSVDASEGLHRVWHRESHTRAKNLWRQRHGCEKWVEAQVYQTKRSKNVPDLESGGEAWMRARAEEGFRSALFIPILREGECIAHLALLSIRKGAFTAEHEELMTAVAGHLGSAIRTARLQEEEARSRKLFKSVVDDNPQAVMTLDTDGKIIFWNPAAERLFGFDEAEALGRRPEEFLVPEGLRAQRGRALDQVFAGRAAWFDTDRLRKDGSLVPVSITISPIKDDGGRTIARTVIYRDRTERVRAEKVLRDRTRALGERVKELRCLYSVSKVLEKRHISVDEMLQEVVELIPPAWEFPEITCARIVCEGRELKTTPFKETIWKQASQIMAGRVPIGAVEVFYTEERPEQDEGPFIREERLLIDELADRLGQSLERRRLDEALQHYADRLETLSRTLMEAQEVERRRIARGLHDEIGQSLTALKLNLEAMWSSAGAASLAPRVEEGITILEDLLQKVRDLSLDLRPAMLDDLGLVAALRWYVNHHAQRAGLAVEFVTESPERRLPPHIETACFRIAQEACTNSVRHARANQVRIELRELDAELELVVRDDGIGFDVPSAVKGVLRGKSFGLLGMRERALLAGGRVEIESAPGKGTEVRVRFPLTPPSSSGDRGHRRRSR